MQRKQRIAYELQARRSQSLKHSTAGLNRLFGIYKKTEIEGEKMVISKLCLLESVLHIIKNVSLQSRNNRGIGSSSVIWYHEEKLVLKSSYKKYLSIHLKCTIENY